jgi:CBS domain-containing protein
MEISGTVSAILSQKGQDLWSIGPAETVFEAIRLMAEKGVGALPVMQDGRLIGMLSERDYTRKVMLRGRSSKETPVREIMTDTLVSAHPGDSVVECMETMTERRIRHLPVMQDGRLVGIVSIGDLVKWIISAQGATIDQLTKYVFGE